MAQGVSGHIRTHRSHKNDYSRIDFLSSILEGVTPVEPYDNNQGFGHLSLQNSIYLPGKTNIQLQAYDRESVIDGLSRTYDVKIDTTGGCTSEDLSVTL